ncbi:Oligopeptide transport system permease protein OppC [Pigmentiphaga humi]|uniref:Oligopeptide transport system permease protein OppC n=1 Tax=Pigmentiphaga humi TaxID=2478468 RepID=A0A3P4B3G4_9BURK|nr:ABC transporter permease [Pigmentiphaga humi]VCU70823.1 Oligopeptide transport system permease protein OppC [Pigmentiphaga humi]
MPKLVFLWTDVALFLLVLAVAGYAWHARRSPNLRATWSRVARDTPAMCAAVVMGVFVLIGLLDSLHYRPLLESVEVNGAQSARAYAPVTRSVLDDLLEAPMAGREKTYSAPLAVRQFTKESMLVDGKPVRDYPRLRHGGAHLEDPDGQWLGDVLRRTAAGAAAGLAVAAVVALFASASLARRRRASLGAAWRAIVRRRTRTPLGPMLLTFGVIAVLGGVAAALSTGYHALGTDSTGNDVLVQTVKSFRTALVIGSLTTLATLPLALSLGIMAGYLKGWVDDVIQYVYTTLTSIPGVLLIAACVLMVQVFIDTNPELFETGAERADLRLFLLCIILGVTGWAGLCRLLRAETLKLRELDYVLAARAFGASPARIMLKHLLPNVMHIVLITVVLDFSTLVLYEAVLSYLGVGVDPSMNSFGSMINLARLEMSRDPMIWWNLLSAFVFMLALVLSANLFADAVREAFDPRARSYRPAWARRRPTALQEERQ